MSKQKRYNLNYRSQSTEGSLLAETTKWFNKMPIEEKTQTISHLLIMNCTPLVKADGGASQEELKKYYWEFEQWVCHYKYVLRERLNLQGQFSWDSEPRIEVTRPFSEIQEEDNDEEEDEDKVISLKNQLIGGESAESADSLFDELG